MAPNKIKMFLIGLTALCVLIISCEALLEETNEGQSTTKTVMIQDPHNNMRRFEKDVVDLLLNRRKKVRIAYYGDSNNAADYASGYLRQYLGKVVGYGGHGYILAGQPLAWYQHRDIKTRGSRGWATCQVTVPRSKYYPYGHGGGVGIGYYRKAYAKFTSHPTSPNGVYSKVIIHYLCNKGSFNVVVDGKVKLKVNNNCRKMAFRSVSLDVPLGKHKLKIVTVRPSAVVFGVSFEKERGIVVDGFGIGAANIWHLTKLRKDLFIKGLKDRDYSLVILHLGTNLYRTVHHYGWMKKTVARIREALGNDVPILVLSPPPRGFRRRGAVYPHLGTRTTAKEKEKYALKLKCAYWNYLAASGGYKSIRYWYRKKFFYGDLVHSRPQFHKHMSALLYNALIRNFFLKRERHK